MADKLTKIKGKPGNKWTKITWKKAKNGTKLATDGKKVYTDPNEYKQAMQKYNDSAIVSKQADRFDRIADSMTNPDTPPVSLGNYNFYQPTRSLEDFVATDPKQQQAARAYKRLSKYNQSILKPKTEKSIILDNGTNAGEKLTKQTWQYPKTKPVLETRPHDYIDPIPFNRGKYMDEYEDDITMMRDYPVPNLPAIDNDDYTGLDGSQTMVDWEKKHPDDNSHIGKGFKNGGTMNKRNKSKGKYIRKAEDGITSKLPIQGSMQIGGQGTIQPQPMGLSAKDNTAGVHAAGPMPKQGGYQAAQGPAFEQYPNQNPDPENNSYRNNAFGNFVGRTFNGARSTDLVAGVVQGINAFIPNTPIANNQKRLVDAYNPYPMGTGSHASFENGGELEEAKKGFKLNPKHKGWCTPLSNPKCTGKRRQFAINAKNHFKKKHEDGGEIAEYGQDMDQPFDPITWNRMQGNAQQQGFQGNDHIQQPGVDFMQNNNVDPNQLRNYQQRLLDLSQANPIKGVPQATTTDPSGKFSPADNHYGHLTNKERFTTYRTNINGKETDYGTNYNQFNQDNLNREARQNQLFQPIVQNNQPPIGQGFNKPVADSVMVPNAGFPTREQAIAKSKGRKQQSNWHTNEASDYSMKMGGNIGYLQGMEYDLPEEEVKRLQKLGYQLEY